MLSNEALLRTCIMNMVRNMLHEQSSMNMHYEHGVEHAWEQRRRIGVCPLRPPSHRVRIPGDTKYREGRIHREDTIYRQRQYIGRHSPLSEDTTSDKRDTSGGTICQKSTGAIYIGRGQLIGRHDTSGGRLHQKNTEALYIGRRRLIGRARDLWDRSTLSRTDSE